MGCGGFSTQRGNSFMVYCIMFKISIWKKKKDKWLLMRYFLKLKKTSVKIETNGIF